MEFIILLALMTASASSVSLDAEPCGIGESFWCQSFANAEACGAVDHCRETAWKNMQLNENITLRCKTCIAVIEIITTKINISGVIEETILTYFCRDTYPFPMLCKGIVKLLVPQIVNNLRNWLINYNICQEFHFCVDSNHSASLSMHQEYEQRLAARKPTACQLCIQTFKATTENEVVNKTEATFLTAMRLVCDSLWWPHGNHCHKMVDAIGRPALEKLSKHLHPEGVCQMIGFCDGASIVDIINDKTVSSERCSYCQSTAKYLSVLLTHGKAVCEIQSRVKRICEFRPFGMNDEECKFVVDKYTPVLVDYLIDDLSRDNVCQMESFCGRASK